MQQLLLLFLGDLGGSELTLILVVILIFFGAKRIPELARGLGRGLRELKNANQEIRSEIESAGLPASAVSGPLPRPAAYASASQATAAATPPLPFPPVQVRPLSAETPA